LAVAPGEKCFAPSALEPGDGVFCASNMKFFMSHIELSRVRGGSDSIISWKQLDSDFFFCEPMGSFRFKDDVFFGKYNDHRVLCYFHLKLLTFRQCYSLKFETKVMVCKFWCNPMIYHGSLWSFTK
jgi:hypothetical protein